MMMERKFHRDPLWAAVGNEDVVLSFRPSLRVWIKGITIFHFQNHIGQLLSLVSLIQNIFS